MLNIRTEVYTFLTWAYEYDISIILFLRKNNDLRIHVFVRFCWGGVGMGNGICGKHDAHNAYVNSSLKSPRRETDTFIYLC